MFQLSESTVYFHIDVTFEMRTVLYGSSLSIDDHENVGQSFYIKKRLWGREQDSVETERECV